MPSSSLLFSRLNSPSSFRLSAQRKCSCVFITFMALFWTQFNNISMPLYWGSQNWTWQAEQRERSFPFTCWQHSSQHSPGGCWHSGALLGHGLPADSRTPRSFSAFQLLCPQPVPGHGIVPPQVQDLAFPLLEFHKVLIYSVLQPVEVPWIAPQQSGVYLLS